MHIYLKIGFHWIKYIYVTQVNRHNKRRFTMLLFTQRQSAPIEESFKSKQCDCTSFIFPQHLDLPPFHRTPYFMSDQQNKSSEVKPHSLLNGHQVPKYGLSEIPMSRINQHLHQLLPQPSTWPQEPLTWQFPYYLSSFGHRLLSVSLWKRIC